MPIMKVLGEIEQLHDLDLKQGDYVVLKTAKLDREIFKRLLLCDLCNKQMFVPELAVFVIVRDFHLYLKYYVCEKCFSNLLDFAERYDIKVVVLSEEKKLVEYIKNYEQEIYERDKE